MNGESSKQPILKLWRDGLWSENPALIKMLGLCPLLAISNSTINAIGLSVATLFVLVVSNLSVSICRNFIQTSVRLPIYVLIIATSVTTIDLYMQAYFLQLHAALGIFLPLIVTNCLIIGRAEAFASRHSVVFAFTDAMAMGIGFGWILIALGAIREILGTGSLFGNASVLFGESADRWSITVFPADYSFLFALLPPGAFITLGLLLALKNAIDQRSN